MMAERSVAVRQLLSPETVISAAKGAAAWVKPLLRNPDFAPPASLDRGDSLGRIGSLEVYLATTKREIKRTQKLRYKVFFRDGNAIADAATLLSRRDKDPFDKICDHLIVVDHAAISPVSRKPRIVGTYRLLRQEVAQKHDGFYTENEFEIDPLLKRHPQYRFLELGRSCVLPSYRSKRTVELLWQGLLAYVRRHRVDVMIGCASLSGTDPKQLAQLLSFLHHFSHAPDVWRAAACRSRYVSMDLMRKADIDTKAARRQLPPLIKGYLRAGAYVGDGAIIDRQFGTTDVLMIVPVAAISARYVDYFDVEAASAPRIGAPVAKH